MSFIGVSHRSLCSKITGAFEDNPDARTGYCEESWSVTRLIGRTRADAGFNLMHCSQCAACVCSACVLGHTLVHVCHKRWNGPWPVKTELVLFRRQSQNCPQKYLFVSNIVYFLPTLFSSSGLLNCTERSLQERATVVRVRRRRIISQGEWSRFAASILPAFCFPAHMAIGGTYSRQQFAFRSQKYASRGSLPAGRIKRRHCFHFHLCAASVPCRLRLHVQKQSGIWLEKWAQRQKEVNLSRLEHNQPPQCSRLRSVFRGQL